MDSNRQLFEILKAVEETQKKVAALADVVLSTIPSTGTSHLFDVKPELNNPAETLSDGCPTFVFPSSTFEVSGSAECSALRQEVREWRAKYERIERELRDLRLQLHLGHGMRLWEPEDLGENGHH